MIIVLEAGGHALEDLDLVVDARQGGGIQQSCGGPVPSAGAVARDAEGGRAVRSMGNHLRISSSIHSPSSSGRS